MKLNKGKIFALDPNPNKLEQLYKIALRNGVSNIQILTTGNKEFYLRYKEEIDAVLIDAPCSGLGVIRRNPAIKWHMNPKKIIELEQLQKDILNKNAPLVKKGGVMVYATCSIFPNENKLQIADFINSKEGEAFELIKDQTFLSNESNFDGFYIAKLKKT